MLMNEEGGHQRKMQRLPSDDGKKYDFDFYALSKIKKREKLKVFGAIVVIVLLVLALIAMVVLYQYKSDKIIYRNITTAAKIELQKAKLIAYQRIAKYGEDCHTTGERKTLCGANAYCRYLQGTYRCDCKEGFVGDGIGNCRDVHFAIDFRTPAIYNIPVVRKVDFPETEAVSVCFWYKMSNVTQKWMSAFMYTSVEIHGSNDLMIWFSNDKIHATMRSSGITILGRKLALDYWTHFCWVWESSGKWSTFLSGKRVHADYTANKKSFAGKFEESHGNFILGQDQDDDHINEPRQMFRGSITQLYLYHKKLSDDEVMASYERRPPIDNIIVGWWMLEGKTNGTDIVQTKYPFEPGSKY